MTNLRPSTDNYSKRMGSEIIHLKNGNKFLSMKVKYMVYKSIKTIKYCIFVKLDFIIHFFERRNNL